MTTLGLKNVNLLSKEQYDTIAEPATDELYAISGSGFGFPSSKYVDLTLGASGSTYTAPANGYFYLNKVVGSDWYYAELSVVKDGKTLFYIFADGYRTSPASIMIPVKKGDMVVATYNATGATNHFRFIYAEGEE
jgi:hypothetical protein